MYFPGISLYVNVYGSWHNCSPDLKIKSGNAVTVCQWHSEQCLNAFEEAINLLHLREKYPYMMAGYLANHAVWYGAYNHRKTTPMESGVVTLWDTKHTCGQCVTRDTSVDGLILCTKNGIHVSWHQISGKCPKWNSLHPSLVSLSRPLKVTPTIGQFLQFEFAIRNFLILPEYSLISC
jgi:hypothetical protein